MKKNNMPNMPENHFLAQQQKKPPKYPLSSLRNIVNCEIFPEIKTPIGHFPELVHIFNKLKY